METALVLKFAKSGERNGKIRMAKIEVMTIQTDRLVLRRRIEDDIPYMTQMFCSENVRKYLGGYPPRDEHSMLKIIRSRGQTHWHIALKDTNEFIGQCDFNKIVDGVLGEIGYIFKEESWGKGYAFEALTAIINYGFDTLNLKRIFATNEKGNSRSVKLIEKLGFILDAEIADYDFGGRVTDILYYSKKAV